MPLLKKPKLLNWERDTTAPTLASASRSSNTHIFVTLSENADDATLAQANDG